MTQLPREFRIFEVSKDGDRFFVCKHTSLESAKYWLRNNKGSFIILDEWGHEWK